MFLKNPKLLFKSISFRIIIWVTVFFSISFFAINVYAYTFISSIIYKQSRSEVEEDIRELQEIYQKDGLESLKFEVFEDSNDILFVRLVTKAGDSAILKIPGGWRAINPERFKQSRPTEKEGWEYLPDDRNKNIYEIRSLTLSDGSVLQMGQRIEEREEFLSYFRKVYLISLMSIVIIVFSGGIFVADRALDPIRQLINTLDTIISEAKVKVRVPENKSDNLYHELNSVFNSLLAKIENLMNGIREVLDNLAHDLRTPMARLRITAETAIQSKHNEQKLRESLTDCVEESDRILLILNTILDVSEAETGVMKMSPKKLHLPPLIEDVVEMYGYAAEDKNILLYTSCPEELHIFADRHRFRQVLANLLDNAVKYTNPGGRVDILAEKLKQHIKVTVRDSGIGINDDELDYIWDRLYRGDKSRTKRGLGLGLSLVKAIANAHGGYVQVLSTPGSGSSFSVYIPC